MINVNSLVADLTILNNVERIKLLEHLKNNKGGVEFNDLYKKFSHLNKTEFSMHVRLLYISNLIRNTGFNEKAVFSITPKGEILLDKLENSPDDLLTMPETT